VYIRISAKKVPRFTAKRLILELHSRNGTDLLAIRFYSAISGKSSRSALALNLLNNAWKFTGHRAAGRIEFGSMRQDSGITAYFIKDNGAGFDMNYASKLFGAFQRFHSQEEFSGTGIGLASVQRVVHRHGGQIWAEGIPGKGTTFFFTLNVGARSDQHDAPKDLSVAG